MITTPHAQRIYLTTDTQMGSAEGIPSCLNPEDIYAAAHGFQIIELQNTVMDFLSYSCDRYNIVLPYL